MNNIEKKLAEKVMYAIYIKNEKNIFETYCNYIKYLDIVKDKKDKELLEKVNGMYKDYFKGRVDLIR